LPLIAFADYFSLLRYATIRHFITSPPLRAFDFAFHAADIFAPFSIISMPPISCFSPADIDISFIFHTPPLITPADIFDVMIFILRRH
jgi:hypothetical protein